MFRLLFAVAIALLLWLQSLFTHVVHTADGDHHVFAYGPVAWGFTVAFVLVIWGFAALAWKWLHDRAAAWILLLCSPLMALAVLPQILYERVELTETEWRFQREPPQTKYNATVKWDDIKEVLQIQREDRSFGESWNYGYDLTMKDGRQLKFPSNTVITAAKPTIDEVLQQHHIPINIRRIRGQSGQ